MKDKAKILTHYIHAALWVEQLDADFDTEHVHPECLEKAKRDIDTFVEKAGSLLDGIDEEMIGHDILLTRNHHGCGFWDRGYPKAIGDALTQIAHDMKEVTVSEEDGVVFIE